jgi:hypothetical protein
METGATRRPFFLGAQRTEWWARLDSNQRPKDSLNLAFPRGVDYLIAPEGRGKLEPVIKGTAALR